MGRRAALADGCLLPARSSSDRSPHAGRQARGWEVEPRRRESQALEGRAARARAAALRAGRRDAGGRGARGGRLRRIIPEVSTPSTCPRRRPTPSGSGAWAQGSVPDVLRALRGCDERAVPGAVPHAHRPLCSTCTASFPAASWRRPPRSTSASRVARASCARSSAGASSCVTCTSGPMASETCRAARTPSHLDAHEPAARPPGGARPRGSGVPRPRRRGRLGGGLQSPHHPPDGALEPRDAARRGAAGADGLVLGGLHGRLRLGGRAERARHGHLRPR